MSSQTIIENTEIFSAAKWIWAEDNSRQNDWVYFRRKFTLEKPPKSAVARIAAESGYNLYVNGRLAVFCGGLGRESKRGCGYYDELDLAEFLVKGENAFALLCRYDGRDGTDSLDAGAAGLLFECGELGIHSDPDFLCYRTDAFSPLDDGKEPAPNAERPLRYDYTKEGQIAGVYGAAYGAGIFVPSVVCGSYGDSPWGGLIKRPIPLFKFSDEQRTGRLTKSAPDESGNITYTAELGKYCLAAPVLDITSPAGLAVIGVCTDRYECLESGATRPRSYFNRRLEYVCSEGKQTFSSPVFLAGTKFIIKAPQGVKISGISYIETSYDFESEHMRDNAFGFDCGIKTLSRLTQKAVDSLAVCMRGVVWNTPERERATRIGGLSGAAELASYTMTDSGFALFIKCAEDCLTFFEDGAFYSGIPGGGKFEDAAMNLLALSERGIFAACYHRAGDADMLRRFIGPAAAYLQNWCLGADGLIEPRVEQEGGSFDAGANVDAKLLENCLYYSALRFLRYAADKCGVSEYSGFTDAVAESIKNNFADAFYKPGSGYSSDGRFDERANAWAVIAGLAAPEHSAELIRGFRLCMNCSPLWENYVIEALCMLRADSDAVLRMLTRFAPLVNADCPALFEDFGTGVSLPSESGGIFCPSGAMCSSYSGAAVKNLFRYFAGLRFTDGAAVGVEPSFSGFSDVEFTACCKGGGISGSYRGRNNRVDASVVNKTDLAVTLVLGENGKEKPVKLAKGKNKFVLQIG
ncbi:MAG: hypothetical protein LBP26_01750 [Clostridiales bacterium]|jgi:hypothetical protein|nr:hypothetical protein [Clostridiales bacterium]